MKWIKINNYKEIMPNDPMILTDGKSLLFVCHQKTIIQYMKYDNGYKGCILSGNEIIPTKVTHYLFMDDIELPKDNE